jgi:apolipoprotein N-acyltransferase
MVRAAATGISAIIDPYGRLTGSLSLGAQGVVDGALPNSIGAPLFARHSGLLLFALWLLTAALSHLLRLSK